MHSTSIVTYRVALVALAAVTIGCDATSKRAKYPDGALPVPYEAATSHSTCLVSSVAMAANYLVGRFEFTEKEINARLEQSGQDGSRVADLKAYLAEQGLFLLALSGRLEDAPPTGMGFWIRERRYPVICIINRDPGGDPGFNHAVVVIGVSPNKPGQLVDMIHYFDPSTEDEPLHSDDAGLFEILWDRTDRAMMIVVDPPVGTPGRQRP